MTRRLISVVAILGFFATTVVLLLSDRVSAGFPLLSSAVRTVGRRVEAITGIDVIDREQIPFDTDLLGHAALWFTGMIVIGFALRKKIPVIVTALVLIAIGIGFEFGQYYWTQSRHLSVDDAIANAVGITAGAFVVLVVGAVIDTVGYVRRRLRSRHAWHSEPGAYAPDLQGWDRLEPTATQPIFTQPDPWLPPTPAAYEPVPAAAPTWRYGTGADRDFSPAPTGASDPDAAFRPPPRPMVEPTREQSVR